MEGIQTRCTGTLVGLKGNFLNEKHIWKLSLSHLLIVRETSLTEKEKIYFLNEIILTFPIQVPIVCS